MNDSIPICRSVFKHWIYKDAEYLKVWLTMLGRARYIEEPKTDMYEKILYTLNYGEFIFGRPTWCKDTGISEQRLRRLVELLINDGMITKIRKTSKFTIYKIVNYAKFNQQLSQENQGTTDIDNFKYSEEKESSKDHVKIEVSILNRNFSKEMNW
jgi:hypothetical protein